jgi:hypothetical protein
MTNTILLNRVLAGYNDRGLDCHGVDYIVDFINDYFADPIYPRLGINNFDMLVDYIVDDLCAWD